MGVPGKMLVFRNCSGGEGSRVRGSGEKQLPGPDGRQAYYHMPEEVEDYGACSPGSLNPEQLLFFNTVL
jgi:hypothetical protein